MVNDSSIICSVLILVDIVGVMLSNLYFKLKMEKRPQKRFVCSAYSLSECRRNGMYICMYVLVTI